MKTIINRAFINLLRLRWVILQVAHVYSIFHFIFNAALPSKGAHSHLRRGLFTSAMVFGLTIGIDGEAWSAPIADNSAQSVMLENFYDRYFMLRNGETWEFNWTDATAYYTNAWDGVAPTISCKYFSSGAPCNSFEPMPPIPPAPAPDTEYVSDYSTLDECVFWAGGTLTASGSYAIPPIKVYIRPSPARPPSVVWTFQYTYLVAPAGDGSVAARTAWVLASSSYDGETVPVTINTTISSETAIANTPTAAKPWSRQFSFSMVDSAGASRIQQLKVKVKPLGAPDSAALVQLRGHTILKNLAYPADDFLYTGANGEVGNLSLLAERPSDPWGPAGYVGLTLDGLMYGFDGVPDDDALNNTDVAFSDFAQKAVMDPAVFNLGPGCYQATVTAKLVGKLKGIADLPMAGIRVVGISADTCVAPVVTGCTSD